MTNLLNSKITKLKLNRGIDVAGIDNNGDEIYYCSGASINMVSRLLEQYGNGEIMATFNVHPAYYDKDMKTYKGRIKRLLRANSGLFKIGEYKNLEIDGNIFPNTYTIMLKYERA